MQPSIIPDSYTNWLICRFFGRKEGTLFVYFWVITHCSILPCSYTKCVNIGRSALSHSLIFWSAVSVSFSLSLIPAQKTLTCSRSSQTWPHPVTKARCGRVTIRLLNSLWAMGHCWSLWLTDHTPWPTAKWRATADTSPAASPHRATSRRCRGTLSTPPTAPSTSWEDVLPSPTQVSHRTAS